jgi:hypothetical protein
MERFRGVLDAIWDRLGTMAERYLRAVAARSRFPHRYERELAKAALGAPPLGTRGSR